MLKPRDGDASRRIPVRVQPKPFNVRLKYSSLPFTTLYIYRSTYLRVIRQQLLSLHSRLCNSHLLSNPYASQKWASLKRSKIVSPSTSAPSSRPFSTQHSKPPCSHPTEIEYLRLEQRYTKRKPRAAFASDAQYKDGEYVYSPTGSTNTVTGGGGRGGKGWVGGVGVKVQEVRGR